MAASSSNPSYFLLPFPNQVENFVFSALLLKLTEVPKQFKKYVWKFTSAAIRARATARSPSTGEHCHKRGMEEFKRVFAIVDTDGSGTITLNELQQLMQNMRGGKSCTRTEVALIQEAIDCDKNESISLDEFIQALTRWTASSKGIDKKFTSDNGKGLRRRGSSGDVGDFSNARTREEIIADIAAFFNQFEQVDWNTKLQRVRDKFKRAENSEGERRRRFR